MEVQKIRQQFCQKNQRSSQIWRRHIVLHRLINQSNNRYQLTNYIINNQKMEDEFKETQPKINSQNITISKIDKIQLKCRNCYEKVIDSVQNIIQAIQQSEKKLQSTHNSSQIISQLHLAMTETRPLKTVRQEFNSFYKRLSAFGKTIAASEILEFSTHLQLPHLEETLAEHFSRQAKCISAQALTQKLPYTDNFAECNSLKEQIKRGQVQNAIKWTENEKLFETYEILIEYELKKIHLLKLVRENKHLKALEYCKNTMIKFVGKKEEQINKLIMYLLLEGEMYGKDKKWSVQNPYLKLRYQHFQENNLGKVEQQFTEIYLNHYRISVFDSIAICYEAGIKHRKDFIKNFKIVHPSQLNRSLLPFSLTIEDKNKYHSVFLCPVNKEILSSKEGTVLLKCGHVISESAFSKIMDNRMRKKLKCPVCQQQQRLEDAMQIQF